MIDEKKTEGIGKWIRPRPFLPCHCSECLATYTGRGETPDYCSDCGVKMIKEIE